MHSVLSDKTCVRLLKCVYYGLNRNQTGYAYKKLRFCSNHNVFATTAIQKDCCEVSRQDARLELQSLATVNVADDEQLE